MGEALNGTGGGRLHEAIQVVGMDLRPTLEALLVARNGKIEHDVPNDRSTPRVQLTIV